MSKSPIYDRTFRFYGKQSKASLDIVSHPSTCPFGARGGKPPLAHYDFIFRTYHHSRACLDTIDLSQKYHLLGFGETARRESIKI